MSDPVLRAVAFALAVGLVVGVVVLCGGWMVGVFDQPAGPPIVIPTTYGPPSTGVVP